MWSGLHSVATLCFILLKKDYKFQAGNNISKILTQANGKIHTFPGEGCKNSQLHAVTSLKLFPDAPCLTAEM